MTSVTRSAQRVKNEANGSSKSANSSGRVKDSKTSTASGSAPTDSSTLRRSARETSSKKQQLLSLSSNSKKTDKVEHRAPSTPLSKNKSVHLGTQSTPSPSGRYERWEKRQVLKGSGSRNSDRCSCSSSSRKSDKSSSSSSTKKSQKSYSASAVKKSKKRIDCCADGATTGNGRGKSEEVGGGDASTPLKKKRMNARAYRASLGSKRKKVKQSAPDESSRENGNVLKRDIGDLGSSGLKEAEEGVDDCSSRKDELLKEKHLAEHGEETIEASSSTPRKLAAGNSTNDGDRTEVSTFTRKRKLCSEEVRGSDFSDSQSEDTDRILQVASAEYVVTEKEELETAVDGVKRAKTVCPMQESPANFHVISSTSSEGKSLTAEYEVEEGLTDGQSKKRNQDRLSDVCLACKKPEGIVNGSQVQEVSACNTKRNSEAHQEAEQGNVVTISFQKDKHMSRLSPEDGEGLGAWEKSADAENGPEHAILSLGAAEDTPHQLKEDGKGHGVHDAAGIVRQVGDTIQQEPADGGNNACVKCKLGGKLLCCDRKGCGRRYHLSCLDPSMNDVPFGAWYCLSCIEKKMKFGVHSISDGVESICIINDEGMQNEKKYFVKYRGLSHVHNCWITESQLMQEAPMLLKKRSKEKLMWKKEWTEPQRLLRKRLVISQKDGNMGSDTEKSDSSSYLHEWLVKWKGLGYDEATWELENEAFLSNADARKLMENYEIWRGRARKQSDLSAVNEVKDASLTKLSKLPVVGLSGLDHHLSSINKLLENWQNSQNALLIDEQERITKAILFILALQCHVSRPFLVISTMSTLPHWESEFMHLAPSLNVVVYNGDKSIRKNIQALEFYDESGLVLFEVLLTIPDAIIEDINTFECLGWEAIIVDECHRSRLLKQLSLRLLTAGFKLFLASSQMKDNTSEYLNLLSHLEPDGSELNIKSIDSSAANLSMLKEKVARYVVSEQKSDSSKFVEYWVPVLLSDVQLEQYCRTLVDNTMSLRSCSKNDSVGAIRDMLISLRKCCDHPYLVEPSLQTTLAKGVPEILLDVGINASGKLQLLDKILSEAKKKKLRVVILFQTICGSGGIGDILDDYVRQRFGQDSYERIDSGLVPSKRQHALNIFNNLETGRFVFLLESRACRSTIKLSSVDAVIIFNSDWNPVNDFRALQKIHIDPQTDQLKVLRLYSPFTVEEKTLILANKDTGLESNVQNISHTTSHLLLMWGASYLFDKLDEFHGNKSPSVDSNEFSYDDMVQDIVAALQNDGQSDKSLNVCSFMSKVHQTGAVYTPTNSVLGERKMLVSDEGPPSVFWTKLLDKRFHFWKYLPETSQRPRKKAKYVDNTLEETDADNDELKRKRHKVANSTTVDPISLQPWIEEQKRKAVSGVKDSKIAAAAGAASLTEPLLDSCSPERQPHNGKLGTSTDIEEHHGLKENEHHGLKENEHHGLKENEEHLLPKTLNCSTDSTRNTSEVGEIPMVESESCRKLRDAQKSLHTLLKPEISKLCETLQLPEEVMEMATKFLEYIMNNHHVNREPKSILQAFMIALCWRAASLLKYKVNHKESLLRAKQDMEFECKEEEAESVYEKLRQLKKRFSHQMNLRNDTKLKSLENQASPPNASQAIKLELVASDQQCLAGNARGSPLSNSHSVDSIPLEQESIPPLQTSKPDLDKDGCNLRKVVTNKDIIVQLSNQVEETFSRRKEEILETQKKEILEFKKYKDGLKEKMKKDHELEAIYIKCTYADYSLRLVKLKLLDENFAKKMKELDKHIDSCFRELVLKQYKARQKEESLKALCLVKANCGSVSLDRIPLSKTGFDIKCMGIMEQSEVHNLDRMRRIPVAQSQDVDKVDSGTAELPVPAALPSTSAAPENDNDEMITTQSESVTATAVGRHNQENVDGASLQASSLVDDIPPSQVGRILPSSEVDSVLPSSEVDSVLPSSEVDSVLPSSEVDNLPPSSRVENIPSSSQVENSPPSQVDNIPPSSQVENIYPSLVEPSNGSCPNDPVLSHEVPSGEPNQPPTSAAVVENAVVHIPEVTSSQMCSSSTSIPQRIEAFQVNDSLVMINELQQNYEASCSSEQITAQRQRPNTCSPSPDEQLNHSERQAIAGGSRRIGSLPDPTILPGPSTRSPLIHPSASGRPLLLHPDPLQNELAKIGSQKDLATRMHEEEKSQLRLQCEKEVEEIRRKYNGLVQEVEMRLNQRLLVLDSQYNKVHMNRILAGVCKFKFDPKRPVHSRQGTPSSTSTQQFPRPFPQPPVSQTAQPPPRTPAPAPLQVHNTSALFSGNLGSSHYSPGVPRAFPQGGAEVRAPPPHLLSHRPPTFPSPGQGHLPMSSSSASQHMLSSSAQLHPSYPSSGPIGTNVIDHPGIFLPNRSSALELLKDIDSRARLNRVQPPLAVNTGATLDALLMSEFSQVRRPRPPAADANDAAAAPDDVICLSDDDE
ncbi:hypothetical protein H6P81_011766 [Aristolochia fimbriata]|uniref:Helicase protein MOM1 n=1 Tax=Aristolochia fimbriata TaxID=158543 RepID=A0AAV7EEI4_ARIFI|nr:hypothetical protein H6P81_011766 [Aristolochia fimbriata]